MKRAGRQYGEEKWPFPPSQTTARLTSLADIHIFPISPRFFGLFPLLRSLINHVSFKLLSQSALFQLRSQGSSRVGLNSYFTQPLPNRIVPRVQQPNVQTQTALNFAAQERCVWGRISFEVSPLFCPRLRLWLPSQVYPVQTKIPDFRRQMSNNEPFSTLRGIGERSCKVFQLYSWD